MQIPPSLRHRKFLLFWTGMLISMAGSMMQVWTLYWHIRQLSDQPIALSGIGVARFLPVLALSLFGGVLADKFNRRKVLFVTQSIMALVAVCLALLTLTGAIQVWHIYLLTAIQAAANAFDLPARQAMVPNLLPREDLPNAFSMNSIAFNTGAILGPALSGLTISLLGLQGVYWINAASFLALLAMLAAMGPIAQDAPHSASRRVVDFSAIADGIRFIRKQPIILSSMILDFFATFFSAASTLLPFVAKDILKVGVVEYGWLSAGQSMGAVSVGLAFSQRKVIRHQGKLLLGAVIAFGLATVAFGLGRSFWVVLLALVAIGASDEVSTIMRNTIRQMQTPDHLRGRMVSINQIFFMGGPQLGEVESGLVAQAFGVPFTIASGGIGCVLAVLAIGAAWPQLRQYDGSEPAPQSA